MEISWSQSKKRLALLWFLGSGFIFLVLLFQTLNRFHGIADQVWGWFLPTIMPTLSLITAVLVMDSADKEVQSRNVDSFLFKLAFSLSLFYLIVVASTLFLQPLSKLNQLELMKLSNLWLGPFQGLVSASLGVFFIKKKNNS